MPAPHLRSIGLAGFAILILPLAAVGAASTPGICTINSNAPPAVERALDGVLSHIMAPDRELLPDKLKIYFTPDYGAPPGAVLSVQGPGWRYVKAVGLADIAARTPLDCSMPFEIGSNTKMMTATVLLQLQEEGKLSIDDKLARHLPEIADRLPNGNAITLRQLAQHTSGIFDYSDNAPDGMPGILEGDMTDPAALIRPRTPQEMIDFAIAHGRPNFAPGEKGKWKYSNSGFILLGMVIEKIEGLPLQKSFENRIFAPLDMKRSFLWNGVPIASFGLPRAWLKAPFDYETSGWNMSQGWAAGSVISTADDMHRFIDALLSGKLFKSQGTLTLMQQTVPTDSPIDMGYGLGMKQIELDLWGHGGQTLGFLSAYGAFPAQHVTYVAWSNSSTNILAFADAMISEALQSSGALKR